MVNKSTFLKHCSISCAGRYIKAIRNAEACITWLVNFNKLTIAPVCIPDAEYSVRISESYAIITKSW